MAYTCLFGFWLIAYGKLTLYPKGNGTARNKWLSLFLGLADSCSLKNRRYAKFKLRIQNQISKKHCEKGAKAWFSPTIEDWGISMFKILSDLKDSSNGYVVKDTLIVEVEFMVISVVKKLP